MSVKCSSWTSERHLIPWTMICLYTNCLPMGFVTQPHARSSLIYLTGFKWPELVKQHLTNVLLYVVSHRGQFLDPCCSPYTSTTCRESYLTSSQTCMLMIRPSLCLEILPLKLSKISKMWCLWSLHGSNIIGYHLIVTRHTSCYSALDQASQLQYLSITHEDITITRTDTVKYLRMKLDPLLNFDQYVEYIKRKITGKVKLLGRLNEFLLPDTMLML